MKGLKKISTVSQTREVDSYSIKEKFISSWELMENAAHAFVNAIDTEELLSKKILVLCGTGNNGGDGLAVCRILLERGIDAEAILVQFKESLSTDCAINFNKLQTISVLKPSDPLPDFNQFEIIIDALLGTGINGPVNGFLANLIDEINQSGKTIYSIDIPSGLLCDEITESNCVVKSDLVISFQRPKFCFFLPENGTFVKKWQVVDIGLSEEYIQELPSNTYLLDHKISRFVKNRERFSHKGTFGHALIMAGSYGKMGAAVLSVRACLRSGVGLVTAYVPKCGYDILQISAPECMCITDEDQLVLSQSTDIEKYTALGIGPGIGTDNKTTNFLKSTLKQAKQNMVLDADALNIISNNKELLNDLLPNTILTPHPKEFDRLVGTSKNSLERINKQIAFSKKHQCIIVLKGASTSISSVDGELYFNSSGNAGMATGGSGDVLTGIITGLLAQHYEPLLAALIGVYFHGLAGDKAAKSKGESALIASDIIENLDIRNQ